MVESMRNVRAYPAELPILRDLLPRIDTPAEIIFGGRDQAVPPVNRYFRHDRLPHSKLDILDGAHFTWEDAADECASLVTRWRGGGLEQVRLSHEDVRLLIVVSRLRRPACEWSVT